MIKAIIFDWSGTLSDSIHSYHQLCKIIFKKLGREEPTIDDIKMNFTLPYMKFWNKFFPDITKEEQDALFRQTIPLIDAAHLYSGVKETLVRLHSEGIKLFVLSSDPKETLIKQAKEEGIYDLMQEIHCDVYEKGKSLVEIIKKNRLKAQETFYVGDTSGDVEAGKEAGIRTVGISWGFQHKELLKKSNPDYLIDDIDEINKIL